MTIPASTHRALPRAFGRSKRSQLLSLLFLIISADFLLLGLAPGVNLFIFANLVSTVLLVVARTQLSRPQRVGCLLLSLGVTAPLLEQASWMGVVIALAALAIIALAAAGLMPRQRTRIPAVIMRLFLAIPGRLRRAPFRVCGAGDGPQHATSSHLWTQFKVWLIPVGLACGFLILFSIANPMIGVLFDRISFDLLLRLFDLDRIGLWIGVGILIRVLLRPRLQHIAVRHHRIPTVDTLFAEAPLLRSLVLFNLVFALQTGLDLTYLWGGAELPANMSHAQYVHRGAYPLIVTALLAALFVLATMRPGGAGGRSWLVRGLVYLWIAQNVLLCLSAMLRLDLYVEVYSLTELRLAAGIWMGLVAIGLLLILLRIRFNLSSAWLVSLCSMALAAVLFVCAFADLPAFIARFNVEHSREISGKGLPLDLAYISELGPSAVPALDTYITVMEAQAGPQLDLAAGIRSRLAFTALRRPGDWRSWTFRKARQTAYILQTASVAR